MSSIEQNEWYKQYQKEKAERNQRMVDNIKTKVPKIRDQLLAMGVKYLEVSYDGSGDDGCIDSPVLYRDVSRQEVIEYDQGNHPNPAAFKEELETVFYDLIETRGADFNNDGCFGNVAWDLIEDTLKHEHHDRVTTTEDTEYEGW